MKKPLNILTLVASLMFSQLTFATSASENVDRSEHWLNKQADTFDKSAVFTINQFVLENAAARITTCKKVTASSMVYATGGIMGLTGEMGNAHQFKDDLDKKLKAFLASRSTDGEQQQGLTALIAGYDDKINSVKRRLEFMKAAGTTQKIGAAVAYMEGMKRTMAKAKSLMGAQACVAGAAQEIATNPASAQACQMCMQRALSSSAMIQSAPEDLTDGMRGMGEAGKIFQQRDIEGPGEQSSVLPAKKENKSVASGVSFVLKIISSSAHANAAMSCGSMAGCQSCPSVERDINNYFKNRLEGLNVCAGGLKLLEALDGINGDNITGLGTSALMKNLRLGPTQAGIARNLADSVGANVDSWIAKPYNRAIMMEASAQLSAKNIALVSQNLEKTKKNREYVANMLKKLEQERGIIIGDKVTEWGKKERKKYAKRTSTETARSANLDFTDTKKSVGEIKALLKSRGILCAGGRKNGDCQDPNLGDRLVEQGLADFERAKELTEALDIVSKFSVTSSNGKINEALKYVKLLNDPKRVAEIEDALKEIKLQVNHELAQSDQEQIDFEKGKFLFLTGLEKNMIEAIRKTPGAFESLKGNGKPRELAKSNSLGQKFLKANQNNFAQNIADKKKTRKAAGIEQDPATEKNVNPKAPASSEQVFAQMEMKYNDIFENSEKSIFSIISHRYIKSGRARLGKTK